MSARRIFAERRDVRLAAALFVVLLIANIVLSPQRFAPGNWGTLIGLSSPLVLAALAVMVPFLAGRGSIDVSVGPLIGLINVIVVHLVIMRAGIDAPLIIIPVALGLGLLSGMINGFLAAILRIQPIVATLGTYLFYTGLALVILPSPSGTIPSWLRSLSGGWAILPLLAAGLIWLGFKRLPVYEQLMATGGDDRAAYTAGVNVPVIRFIAYCVGGIFAGLAALSLTALIGSGDPAIGPNYTLIAIAAVALGGVSLGGGIGGFTAAVLGALDIFLLQSMLTYFNVSTFILQLSYGVILIIAVSLNSELVRGLGGRK